MSGTLDDAPVVDREGVIRRLDDWFDRLRELRATMEAWARSDGMPDLVTADREPVRMWEEMMARFDLEPRFMPVFDFVRGQQRVMRVRPRGLWVIGANGRVDLVTKSNAPILVDRSEPLSRPAEWHIYDRNNSMHPQAFSQTMFLDLARSGLS